MRARTVRRDEDGEVAAEHVAVLVVVSLAIAALVAAGIPTVIGGWAEYAVCQLFGDGTCERPSSAEVVAAEPDDGPPPPPPCTTSASSRDQRRTVDWLFSRSVNGERYSITDLSDGTVVILEDADVLR